MGFYDYSVPMPKDAGDKQMKDFEGKVVLVVNTATGCGFTPQYKELNLQVRRRVLTTKFTNSARLSTKLSSLR